MFNIKKARAEEFKRVGMRDFELRMAKHLRKYVSIQRGVLGEDQVLKIGKYGIVKAHGYGFTTERNLADHLTLLPVLGSNFDVENQLPWRSKIMTDEKYNDDSDRVDNAKNSA